MQPLVYDLRACIPKVSGSERPMAIDVKTRLQELYRQWCGEPAEEMAPVSADGSVRRYFRITGGRRSIIGAFNPDRKENRAFLNLSGHFHRHGLPVPEIYASDLDRHVYLQQDLGDVTLYSLVSTQGREEGFSDRLAGLYRQALETLARFQIVGGRGLDTSECYPRPCFDRQSMRWDLNYFKYHFLKLVDIPFEEQALEDDFDTLIDFLMEADTNHFLYRDFQSRNLMWFQEQLYGIDYQGGRKGALQYDVASLLLDGKADLPWSLRNRLLDHYLGVAGNLTPLQPDAFLRFYRPYALLRLMQAFGAYGYRGLHQGKSHFVASIPYGLRTLDGLLAQGALPVRLPALSEVWRRMIGSDSLRRKGREQRPGLTVHLRSFSYKQGLPRDRTGHGGGFVFDCRILPNPGRFSAYAHLTGQDGEVIRFLQQDQEVQRFLRKTEDLVDQAVTHHLGRNFTDLTVAFGCTGGRHRSVFCAERLAAHLQSRKDLRVDLHHRELAALS